MKGRDCWFHDTYPCSTPIDGVIRHQRVFHSTRSDGQHLHLPLPLHILITTTILSNSTMADSQDIREVSSDAAADQAQRGNVKVELVAGSVGGACQVLVGQVCDVVTKGGRMI